MGAHPFDDLSAACIATDSPLFHKEKHVSYWLRCLRSPLPHQYTSTDANRMTLAFFTVAALDLLGVLVTRTTEEERKGYADWVYACQHPEGGFRGFPATEIDGSGRSGEGMDWNPATTPATYFALSTLCILSDDFSRVNRPATLRWLNKLQRPNGSFGEMLGENNEILGGNDTRFGYCSMVARWILRGNLEGEVEGVPDIRVDEFVSCVRAAETYDGGVSYEPNHEAQAGFTFCAIGALALTNRLPLSVKPLETHSSPLNSKNHGHSHSGVSSLEQTVRWLVSRATALIDEDDYRDMETREGGQAYRDDEDDDTSSELGSSTSSLFDQSSSSAEPLSSQNSAQSPHAAPNTYRSRTSSAATTPDMSFVKMSSRPCPHPSDGRGRHQPSPDMRPQALSPFDPIHTQWAGFNGRPNKIADTCYGFWVGGSLAILNALPLIASPPIRRYLCEKTQHPIAGGFGKCTGDPPDIYHSYLGLATLALLDIGRTGEEGVLAKSATQAADTRPSGLRAGKIADEGMAAAGARRWMGVGGDVSIQTVDDMHQDREGAGEGGEVGDGGGVLRRLDPALCFSVRAREWLEGLSWRRALAGGEGGRG